MKNIFICILMSMIMIGCNDNDELIPDSNKTGNVKTYLSKSTKRNVLNFQNFDQLEKRIHEILERDTDLLEQSIIDFKEKGRISLLLANNFKEEEAEKHGLKREDIANVNSDDYVLLYLLNSEGEIIVEGTTYKIDKNFVYILKENNKEVLHKFLSEYKEGGIKIANRKVLEYSPYLQVYKHGNNKKEKYVAARRTEYGYFNNDSSVRVKARQFDDYWFFYSSIGAMTKTEQYWSSWVNVKTSNRLKFSVAYEKLHFWSNHIVLGGNHVSDDINKRTYAINKVYEFCVGPPALYLYKAKKGYTLHEAGWYGNNSQRLIMNY